MDTVDITIVGAGVVGTAIAHELSKTGHEVFVIEKNPGVTQGENQSSRNAGVIHSGLFYDQETRPLKARLPAGSPAGSVRDRSADAVLAPRPRDLRRVFLSGLTKSQFPA